MKKFGVKLWSRDYAKNPEFARQSVAAVKDGYFDYIEDLIERENTFNMEQFAASVNEFLSFRRYNILPDRGRISKAQADEKAETEYDIFNRTQSITSDFDREIKRMIEQNENNNE